MCIVNQIEDVQDLIDFKENIRYFSKLKFSNSITSKELAKIYVDYCEAEENRKETANNNIDLNKLNRLQRLVIDLHIKNRFKLLSTRCQNTFNRVSDGNVDLFFISTFLFKKHYKLHTIQNLGKKSITELKEYFKTIEDYITKITKVENDSLKNHLFVNKIYSHFSIESNIVDYLVNVTKSKENNLLGTIEMLINNNCFFKESYNVVFEESIDIYIDQKIVGNKELSIKTGYSYERIRQLKVKLLEEFSEKLKILNIELLDEFNFSNNLILIDKNKEESLNQINKTNFNRNMLSLIISKVFYKEYSLVGDIDNVLLKVNKRNSYYWSNLYLIKKRLSNNFNFNSVLSDLYLKLNEQNEKEYKLNLKKLFLKYNTLDKMEENEILSICTSIISNEFKNIEIKADTIIIPRNTSKSLYEYFYDALEEIGRPSKKEYVYEKVMNRYPDLNIKTSSLSYYFKRENGFIPFGRSGLFGLKKWGQKDPKKLGGTIRELVEQFLAKKELPIHLKEITNHITVYRPNTNKKSVYYNLKMDKSNTFIFFENAYIGLKNKQYDDDIVSELIINSKPKSKRSKLKRIRKCTQKEPQKTESVKTINGDISIDTKVFHHRFGKGTIIDMKNYNDDMKITIRFEKIGVKTLLLSLAKLKIIGK